MSIRQIERMTVEMNYTQLSEDPQADISQKLRSQYPNGFNLSELISRGLLTISVIEKTRMLYILQKTRTRWNEVQQCDDDRYNMDWEEPLHCEWASLIDASGLPFYQTSLIEALVRLYINRKVIVNGPDFMNDKWMITN
jgi:hypothetical protein